MQRLTDSSRRPITSDQLQSLCDYLQGVWAVNPNPSWVGPLTERKVSENLWAMVDSNGREVAIYGPLWRRAMIEMKNESGGGEVLE